MAPARSSWSVSWLSSSSRCRSSGSTRTWPPSSGIVGVLRAFEAAEAGVLVGTQMVAKGHDFPDVTLGVVLDADATLRFPDFRAEERTFALVAQLAGRSGRGERGGRVIVQALEPGARALATPRPRRDRVPRRRAATPRGLLLPALRAPDPGGVLGAEQGPAQAAAGAVRGHVAAAGVPVLGPGAAVPPPGPPPRPARDPLPRARARDRGGARGGRGGGRRPRARGRAFAVDVDPQ